MYLAFNEAWYLARNPDVAQWVQQGMGNARAHFEQYGKVEGRSPTPLFNVQEYLAANPDVASAVARGDTTAYDHFVKFGAAEGRAPLAAFDAAFYVRQHPDVAAAVQAGTLTAVEHWLRYGLNEPRAVNPAIDLGAYLRGNPDVAAAVSAGATTAIGHLLQYGVAESRDLGNGVTLAQFAQDPVFQQALQRGLVGQALDRVADVAPFLPSFQAPAGWTPPANLPIPIDFVPPAGLTLVVPEGVVVQPGVTLPGFFQPVEEEPGGGDIPGGGDPGGSTPPTGPLTFRPNAGTMEGSSDASTAIALDTQYMVVGDDEASVLRVYDRDGGAAIMEWSFKEAAVAQYGPGGATPDAGKAVLGNAELDLEASTRIGDTLYFLGSHSNKSGGNDAPEREFLFSVEVSGTGASTQFTNLAVYESLTSALSTWDTGNLYGLAASAADGVRPEQVSGFSIEGMTASLDGELLYLGFRAPQATAGLREQALIVPLRVDSLTSGNYAFEPAIELNLGGRGIRSIEKAADGSGYLILAGPAGSASDWAPHDFRLYRWDGSTTAPEALAVDLDTLLAATKGSFETLVDVGSVAEGTWVQLLQDNGDTIWSGQTRVSKDLSPAEQQFMGNWVQLGGVSVDETAPVLAATSMATDPAVLATSNLRLFFNEGIKRGAGDLTLRNVSTDEVTTFSVHDTQVKFEYNTLVIDPAANLVQGTAYELMVQEGAILDHAGLSAVVAPQSFTTATSAAYTLLISEVNSDATSGDFFELYNYGPEVIDLSGWRWIDDDLAFDGAVSFAPALQLAPNEVLVVVTGGSATEQAFRAGWNLDPAVKVWSSGGPGLGNGDAVVVYDAVGRTAAAFNYGGNALTAYDGTQLDPVFGAAGHAGAAAGGHAKNSAVWDINSSPEAPVYLAATAEHIGLAGVIQHTTNTNSIGSPGSVGMA